MSDVGRDSASLGGARVPAVSVVVAAYQVAPHTDECLTSIRVQTMGDLEVIVVDDGSTDRLGNIAETHAV